MASTWDRLRKPFSARRLRVAEHNLHVAFPPRGGDGFVTVAELLKALPSLGLPHFQRGRVWDDRAVSMLMESLIDDTPCGSIILWRPRGRISKQGEVPADWGKAEDTARFLVVDGQQRLTALRSLWDDSDDTKWAVNLTAFSEFGLRRHRIQSPDPFVRWPRQPRPTAGPTTRENYKLRIQHLVRLSAVRASGPAPTLDPSINAAAWISLVERIRRADRRRFHVLIKRGCELPEIVNLYNRINSSGVPVRKEERAYAAMVSIDPKTPDWLRECFQAAHPDREDSSREAVLTRERERYFGFPLFISAYTQTVGFHRHLKGDLDLLARDNPDTSWVEDSGTKKSMRSDSLLCVTRTAQTLRSRLLCDDLRFLPSAEPLRLAFAVLLKYPRIDDECLASVLLLGQLNRITGHTRPNRIEQSIAESNRLGEAISALPSAVAMLGDQKALDKRLAKVQSMNDPWVSLMYWYQRARRSRDYLAAKESGDLSLLNRDAAATKEHIVPFSLLYRNYDLDPRGHSASHVVNSIGNLTMVSSDMNYGHGADPIPLRDVDAKLLAAHHLDDPEVLQRYTAVINAIQAGSPKEHIRSRYERFVRIRTQRLAAGMYEWLVKTTHASPSDPDMLPRARRISPSPADQLRKQTGIPTRIKDAMLSIGVKSDGSFWLLHRTSSKYTRADKIRVTHDCQALHIGLGILRADSLTEELGGQLTERFRDEREVVYGLDPHSAVAQEVLRTVARFVAH